MWLKHNFVTFSIFFPTSCTSPYKTFLFHAYTHFTSLWPQGLEPTRLLCPWDSPGKNTGVGCHFFLQENLPTQGLNPGLLHLQADSLPTESPGKPISRWQTQVTEPTSILQRNIWYLQRNRCIFCVIQFSLSFVYDKLKCVSFAV